MKTVEVLEVVLRVYDKDRKIVNTETTYHVEESKAKERYSYLVDRSVWEMMRGYIEDYCVRRTNYSVQLPEEYEITTPEKLYEDLCTGVVESPDFDQPSERFTTETDTLMCLDFSGKIKRRRKNGK